MMERTWFAFRGIICDAMGVKAVKLPDIIRAKRRENTVEIPGRHGALHEDLGSFENYTKSVECLLLDGANIDRVFAWLQGSGEAVFSHEPDKVYRVRLMDTVDMERVGRRFRRFLLQLDTYPLKYSVNKAGEEMELTSGGVIRNPGTAESEPIITLFGTGNMTLTINGTVYSFSGVDGYVTLNSEIMECYKDNVNCNSKLMAADFPRLPPGENEIAFSGAEKIKIEPQWRWL